MVGSSERERIRELINLPKDTGGVNPKIVVRAVSAKDSATIKENTGLDIGAEYAHTIDKSAINHSINAHGDRLKEASRGQIAIDPKDFESLPEVLDDPDFVTTDGPTKKGLETVVWGKVFNGHLVVIEEVRTGKKELALVSMRKYEKGSEFMPYKALLPTSETELPSDNDTTDVNKPLKHVVSPIEANAPAFFSSLERTIDAKMPGRASAEQIRNIVKGTKAEERDWLGTDEFLATKANFLK